MSISVCGWLLLVPHPELQFFFLESDKRNASANINTDDTGHKYECSTEWAKYRPTRAQIFGRIWPDIALARFKEKTK
jgi:hypothetical protein